MDLRDSYGNRLSRKNRVACVPNAQFSSGASFEGWLSVSKGAISLVKEELEERRRVWNIVLGRVVSGKVPCDDNMSVLCGCKNPIFGGRLVQIT